MKQATLYYVEGDLIEYAKHQNFDAITHGCNCFNAMGAGIAPQMAKTFGLTKTFLETTKYKGDYNKLGQIEIKPTTYKAYNGGKLMGINSYTQYQPGKALDYEALIMCFKKLNYYCQDLILGMPKIGCGIAGGDWTRVERLLLRHCKDLTVVVVQYNTTVNSSVKLHYNEDNTL